MKYPNPTSFRFKPDVQEELEVAMKETGLSKTAVLQYLIRNWRKLLKVK